MDINQATKTDHQDENDRDTASNRKEAMMTLLVGGAILLCNFGFLVWLGMDKAATAKEAYLHSTTATQEVCRSRYDDLITANPWNIFARSNWAQLSRCVLIQACKQEVGARYPEITNPDAIHDLTMHCATKAGGITVLSEDIHSFSELSDHLMSRAQY